MKSVIKSCLPAVLLIAIAACSSNGTSAVPRSLAANSNVAQSIASVALFPSALPVPVRPLCPNLHESEMAYCLSVVRTDLTGAQARVSGYGPPDLALAYNLPSSGGTGQTVAIVDAFDDPNAESDLQVYRSNFGLPTCDTSNGCFAKLNQLGQPGPYPTGNSGWAGEISLDVDMVSAVCPSCHIMLVEANDNSFKNLAASVNEAVKLGANVVSNSYGGHLSKKVKKAYDHPGHTIVAAAGDSGYPIGSPAGYPTVTAVGGTTLRRSSGGSRPFTETAWRGTGSGCTPYPKPAYQHDSGCAGRTANDTAAVADPSTGVAIYDTYQSRGWQVIGGTSVSSPVIAGVYGLAANSAHLNFAQRLYEKRHLKDLFDITSGSNGQCDPSYLCNAGPGYDGPTGNGTPNGIGAF